MSTAPPHPVTPVITGRPGAKAKRVSRLPTETSKERLQGLVTRSKRKTGVPFNIHFVRRTNPAAPDPMLATMVRGGRGGEVRLQLLMSMHLIAVRQPYDVTRTASAWARLLALPEPDTNGARRINDASKWLEEHRLIRTERQRGGPRRTFLLSLDGSGGSYARPVGKERWVRVPLPFWQNGWIVSLSGSAIAMWLITKEMMGGRKSPTRAPWVSPLEAKERYGVGDEFRTKGTRELERAGLLTIGRIPQGGDADYTRLRNTYWLEIDRLDETPGGSWSATPASLDEH